MTERDTRAASTLPHSRLFDLSIVHPSWWPVLGPAVEDYLPGIEEKLEGQDFLPAAEDVFRAFSLPLNKVRVLIVGQDPYPTPGHAMGMSFSTKPGVPAPRSLVNIYAELESDLGLGGREDGDLRAWADQGVLLLNRVLTVSPGKAGSHRGVGWQKITEAAIRALNAFPIVAILWGRDAQACTKFLPNVECLCSPHPSPLSAHRGFFGSKPFSRANEALVRRGAQEVDWHL
ncbi:uracil-DNA glycosylase [Corynebacterium sp.]|uniref:uracil-DNA glycosylase n=1 Tax=Corynebacterium sp. TaxID=1720 RepID=UPI0026DB9D86|nr:uracil-DNA glycosylase [Corynebacterium sp.]MDO5031499.1 uracil-DNA glycosylase [Corynebacterium sp.]